MSSNTCQFELLYIDLNFRGEYFKGKGKRAGVQEITETPGLSILGKKELKLTSLHKLFYATSSPMSITMQAEHFH